MEQCTPDSAAYSVEVRGKLVDSTIGLWSMFDDLGFMVYASIYPIIAVPYDWGIPLTKHKVNAYLLDLHFPVQKHFTPPRQHPCIFPLHEFHAQAQIPAQTPSRVQPSPTSLPA